MGVLFECSHTEMKIRTLNPHDCRYEVGYMIFQMSAKMDSVSKFGSPRFFFMENCWLHTHLLSFKENCLVGMLDNAMYVLVSVRLLSSDFVGSKLWGYGQN